MVDDNFFVLYFISESGDRLLVCGLLLVLLSDEQFKFFLRNENVGLNRMLVLCDFYVFVLKGFFDFLDVEVYSFLRELLLENKLQV